MPIPVLLLFIILFLIIVDVAAAFSAPAGAGCGSGGGRPWHKKKKTTGSSTSNKKNEQAAAAAATPNASPRMAPRFMSPVQAKTPREAAYLAALAAERGQAFVSDALMDWSKAKNPTTSEMGLATLVANVACREASLLDYAVRELASSAGTEEKGGGKAVRMKGRQRVILRTALAQYKYCTRTPLYAIVDHAVELAKQYGGGTAFGSFTNALLRKLPPDEEGQPITAKTRPLPVPMGNTEEDLAIRFSYPLFLVRLLLNEFGQAQACAIMEAGNTFPPTMVRSRSPDAEPPSLPAMPDEGEEDDDVASVERARGPNKPAKVPWETVKALPPALQSSPFAAMPYRLGVVRSEKLLRKLTKDAGWYVTNGTPAGLLARLAQGAVARILGGGGKEEEEEEARPLRVLDVCAAPGGKGLAVWDIVRQGQGHPLHLVMNDVNEDKTARIVENLGKFGLEHEVHLTVGDGTTLTRHAIANQTQSAVADDGFDVVILDAPCSNAGVLGRRPEARWRLADDALLKELEATQFALLQHATEELLSRSNSKAEIWYSTCSILACEDEGMVARACAELGLEVVVPEEGGHPLSMKVLPGEGKGGSFDGGYGCALRRAVQTN